MPRSQISHIHIFVWNLMAGKHSHHRWEWAWWNSRLLIGFVRIHRFHTLGTSLAIDRLLISFIGRFNILFVLFDGLCKFHN